MHKHASKGQEIFCMGCGDLIAVFNVDVYPGSFVTEKTFREDKGQGPWEQGEMTTCRKCQEPWHPDQRWFTDPDLDEMV